MPFAYCELHTQSMDALKLLQFSNLKVMSYSLRILISEDVD